MKLKYYLRGIGIGVVVTAILFMISSGSENDKITDTQILQRAQELGMVTQEDYDSVNKDLSDSKTSIDDLKSKLENADEASEEQSDTDNNKEAATETAATDTDSNNTTVQETEIAGSTSEFTTVTFNITPGMGSESVANLLQDKGIIADAKDFNNYIVDSGDSNNLQVGEYEVKTGESYDTILGKITGR
jgi:hypothetical protein